MKKYFVLILVLSLFAPLSLVASAPTPNGSNLQFSLWYTNDLHNSNGTAFPTTLTNCLTVQDIRYASGGVTPSSPGGRVLIVTNDGNVSMNLSAATQNLNMPSNLQFFFSWGNYFGSNMTILAGQSLTFWFIAEAVAGGAYNSNGQWIINYTWGANFAYSFDIVLNATSSGLSTSQIIHVSGNANYPAIDPQPSPSPTPSSSEIAQSTASGTASPTPTPSQTLSSSQEPSSNQSVSPTQFPAGTNITPEFPSAIITIVILLLATAITIITKYRLKIKAHSSGNGDEK